MQHASGCCLLLPPTLDVDSHTGEDPPVSSQTTAKTGHSRHGTVTSATRGSVFPQEVLRLRDVCGWDMSTGQGRGTSLKCQPELQGYLYWESLRALQAPWKEAVTQHSQSAQHMGTSCS